jgi:hypothetical protein
MSGISGYAGLSHVEGSAVALARVVAGVEEATAVVASALLFFFAAYGS